jgi:hypothetical protein
VAKAQILYGFELFSFTPVQTKSSEIIEKGTKRSHSYPLNRVIPFFESLH